MIPNPFLSERSLQDRGYAHVAGIDEVGRGCIAGPVVAACVVLDEKCFPIADQIRDSKKLSEKKREALYPQIIEHAVSYGIGMIDHARVDQINILQATFEAMQMAIAQCSIPPDACLIDGNQKAPIDLPQWTIVKGDQKVISIACASIVAKVFRDRWMIQQDKTYPYYGFAQNKGYGTLAHRQGIAKYGFCPLHRKSFQVQIPT
ncbi:MAG: ribonuclease HII [Bdellovibrionota bacterium]|nr:ribonuclease HII [Deltaproteobacteria bacterium]